MATFLKTLRPNGDDLRMQVDQILQNKQQLQALVDRASRSASELSQLSTPISAAQQAVVSIGERLNALENQMSAIDRLGSRLGKVEAVAKSVAEAQARIEAQLAQSAADAERISGQMDDLRYAAEMAVTLKDDIAEFSKDDSPFQQLRSDADEMGKRVRDLNEGFVRIRERQDEMSRAYKHAMSRFNAFEVEYQGIAKVVDDTETRVNGLQDTMESFGEVAEGVSDARHQLATINVFTDQIGQKVAALEKQREAGGVPGQARGSDAGRRTPAGVTQGRSSAVRRHHCPPGAGRVDGARDEAGAGRPAREAVAEHRALRAGESGPRDGQPADRRSALDRQRLRDELLHPRRAEPRYRRASLAGGEPG
jgi:chromosome segregation ATPase